MTGPEINARISKLLGYRYWLETRGEYTLAVAQGPGDREPWKSSRQAEWDRHAERYTETDYLTAHKTGFFGRDIAPVWSRDIAAAWGLWPELMMAEGGWTLTPQNDGSWHIHNVWEGIELEGKSAPLAICLAFLAWKGAE